MKGIGVRSQRRVVARIGAAVAAIVTVIALSTSPASAGTWAFGHGWGSESSVIPGGHTSGNTVGLWEQMLMARFGASYPFVGPGNWFNHDGVWGPDEQWWTAVWQDQYRTITPGLIVDGYVGPQTWNTAAWWNRTYVYAFGGWEYYQYTDLGWPQISLRRLVSWDAWQTSPILCPTEGPGGYRQISHPTNDVWWDSNCGN
jgi:hypothetical protein